MLLSVYYRNTHKVTVRKLKDITQKPLQLLACCNISMLDSSTQTSSDTEIQRLYTE